MVWHEVFHGYLLVLSTLVYLLKFFHCNWKWKRALESFFSHKASFVYFAHQQMVYLKSYNIAIEVFIEKSPDWRVDELLCLCLSDTQNEQSNGECSRLTQRAIKQNQLKWIALKVFYSQTFDAGTSILQLMSDRMISNFRIPYRLVSILRLPDGETLVYWWAKLVNKLHIIHFTQCQYFNCRKCHTYGNPLKILKSQHACNNNSSVHLDCLMCSKHKLVMYSLICILISAKFAFQLFAAKLIARERRMNACLYAISAASTI